MFWRRRQDRDLEDELAFHQAHLDQHPARFGSPDRVAEECRDTRPFAWLDGVARDLRHGLRSLRRQPGWTAVMVATLALGIGATSLAFSLVYAALLRPLPFIQPDRLVWIGASNPRLGLPDPVMIATPSQLHAWAPDLSRLFSEYAWLRGGGGGIWNIKGHATIPFERSVSVNLFPMLGVKPLLGRLFAPGEDTDAAQPVALISYPFWRRVFGGNPHVLGKLITEQDGPPAGFRIIGVLPPSFHLDQPTELWLPARPIHSTQEFRAYFLLGRRRPGVSLAAVQTAMMGLEHRDPPPAVVRLGRDDWLPVAEPLAQHLAGPLRLPLWLLFAAVACLLLLACANACNLLFARNQQRRAELALRLALGCSRPRLVRQLLLEGALLAAAGAALGLALAAAGLRLLLSPSAHLPADVAHALTGVHAQVLTPAILTFAAALTALTLAGFALGPALRAAGWSLRSRLAGAAPAKSRQRLVIAEAALATILVVGAALLGRSFASLASVNAGFDAGGRVSLQVDMPGWIGQCQDAACNRNHFAQAHAYLDQTLERLRALPGVTAAAATAGVPLDDSDNPTAPPESTPADVFPLMVTPGYFPLMGAPIIAGRDFNSGDIPGATKVIIVNQAFARRFFPGQSPIGLRVPVARCRIDNPDPSHECTIIGVVADFHEASLALTPWPAAYVNFNQDATTNLVFVVRSPRPTSAITADLDRLLPQLPLFAGQRPYAFPPRALDSIVAQSIATPRFRAWLSALLAALALALAAVGVLGVQAYAVARRTSEIGTRMALGARRPDVIRLILAESLRPTAAGALVGLALALAASRELSSLLFHVHTWDSVTLLAAPAILCATAALAAWLPARRAAQVDPASALRAE